MKTALACTILATSLLLTSCIKTHPEINVVYTSSWQDDYTQEVLEGCKKDSATLAKVVIDVKPELDEAGVDLTETSVYKYLLDGCVKHLKLDI